jgi:enoyl-CoA hydratase/carnithine racemase
LPARIGYVRAFAMFALGEALCAAEALALGLANKVLPKEALLNAAREAARAAGGYRVAMIARDAERLARLEHEIPGSKPYACDVSDAVQVEATADRTERGLGGRRRPGSRHR